MEAWLNRVAGEEYCYLTTIGRRTGNPHTIEIWFAVDGDSLYMMAGGRDRSDWVRNLQANPAVRVRFRQEERAGTARVLDPQVDPEKDALARRLLAGKYQGWQEGRPLGQWARTALPVEVRFDGERE